MIINDLSEAERDLMLNDRVRPGEEWEIRVPPQGATLSLLDRGIIRLTRATLAQEWVNFTEVGLELRAQLIDERHE